MKSTALTEKHREAGARMVEFAGYEMPLEYTGLIKEHQAVRNEVGLFDVSHMGEFWIKGEKALDLLQFITTNDVARLQAGQAQYSCLPNGKGGIVDDLIIYRYSDIKYMLVVNASNKSKDWDWISRHNASYGAVLEDASDAMSLLALQGPKAEDILSKLVKGDLNKLQPFHFYTEQMEGVGEVIISATGYTGSGGFELYCYNDGAIPLWEKLVELGKDKGLKYAGLAARDTLRLEKGYALYGNDIDDSTSPVEAGLGWIVKLKSKGEYIDRDLHEKQKAEGVKRKLVGIELLERGIPRQGYLLFSASDEEIGVITSGTMAPTLGKAIGMAYIKTEFSQLDSEFFVAIRNKKIKAKVVTIPFK